MSVAAATFPPAPVKEETPTEWWEKYGKNLAGARDFRTQGSPEDRAHFGSWNVGGSCGVTVYYPEGTRGVGNDEIYGINKKRWSPYYLHAGFRISVEEHKKILGVENDPAIVSYEVDHDGCKHSFLWKDE